MRQRRLSSTCGATLRRAGWRTRWAAVAVMLPWQPVAGTHGVECALNQSNFDLAQILYFMPVLCRRYA